MLTAQDRGVTDLLPGYLILDKLGESYPYVFYWAQRMDIHLEVVIKTLADSYPRKEDVAALQREYQIMRRVQTDGGVLAFELVAFGQGNVALVMERFGVSFKQYLAGFEDRKLPLTTFFQMATHLAEAIGKIHEKKIIHKNIGPSSILIRPESGELRIIDFALSSELAREHSGTASLTKRSFTALPFIAPELTGRINRDIDYRADYYSLGVVFYLALTGRLPFDATDPLEWVHCIISREAPLANTINPNIPASLALILNRLMAKNAEDRYQSIRGLIADLETGRRLHNSGQMDEVFPLAESDHYRPFQIPQKLFGRENEIQQLENCFERVSDGAVEFCLVAGYSGVGKTVLVNELGRSIVRRHGYLISGKFEQFRQNAAYAALGHAFRGLLRQLLGEPEKRLEVWREKISAALGSNAQLIADIVPELALVIGPPAPVHDLSPAETQVRFQLLFQAFVKVFATADHPLVIFLDDLQWSDVPTLHLLSRLATSPELNHLLIIGAYRDNEVDATHPLILTLLDIEKKRSVEKLMLTPISLQATRDLTKATLLCGERGAYGLSEILYEKAGGNPFFTTELMKNLKDRDIIRFDPALSHWDWDEKLLKSVNYSDNVIDVLVLRQNNLPESAQEVLQLAASIGAVFDLKTLSIISKQTPEETAESLNPALRANMVVPLNEDYRLVNLPGTPEDGNSKSSGEDVNPLYGFQHDRVQQAAYSRIVPEHRQALQLSIGRLMLDHCSPHDLDDKLIDIINHLNEGRALIHDAQERRQLAQLNLQAGRKAKQSSAYDAALQYLQIGQEMLNSSAWLQDYSLTWDLHNELQQCYYLTRNWDAADHCTELLLEHSGTAIEKAQALSNRTRQYATTGRLGGSIQAAYEGLSILGFEFVQAPVEADVLEQKILILKNLGNRAIAALIDMPEMTDAHARLASQLIMEIFPAAFLSGSGEMFPYLVLKSVNLALVYGNSPEAAFSYTAYAMILCGLYNNCALGYEYGKLGVAMIERFDDIALKSRIIYVYAMFVHHWSNHWSSMTTWFRKGIEAGYQSGDLLYLAYSAQDCIIWDPQLDLETASQEHRRMMAIVKECEYQDSYDSGSLFLQLQLNFQGLTREKFLLTDDTFDEAACVAGMHARHFMTGISNYHIYKAEIHLMYNDPEGALEHVLEQDKLMLSVIALPQVVRFHIVSFLVRSMLLPTLPSEDQEAHVRKMDESLACMSRWAKHCPENFEHLRLLMEAQKKVLSNNIDEAIDLFELSAASARENDFIRDEAMANELAGQMLLRRGYAKAAEGYLRAAHYLYYRWGAHRKVQEMESAHPRLSRLTGTRGTKAGDIKLSPEDAERAPVYADELDITSVFRASQDISEVLDLEKLLKATLRILMENAGAQMGCLVVFQNGVLHVQAENGLDEAPAINRKNAALLPASIINTAIRTSETIVLADAAIPNTFSSDPYIIEQKPRSVMCVPLPVHGKWPFAVYLENNVTTGAFTEDRVQIIKLLASQASISMENARIYEEQEKLLIAQQRFVPSPFLKHLGRTDIAQVELGESVSMVMSVLFSDIRNFTPLVEKLSPQSVIELLNEYYSYLEKPISACGGFIDSFAGDGLMALFAVPAQQAVKAGIGLSQALNQFNQAQSEKGLNTITTLSGINTGALVLGTMGANDRMQCSVLGDTVNLASRIEQLTRVYDATLLISEHTYKALDEPTAFSLRKVDRVAVKGKAKAVDLYEVLDAEPAERRAAKEANRKALKFAMEAYYRREFQQARTIFRDLMQADPEDSVYRLFADRCERHINLPPPDNWEGYEQLQHK